MHWRLRARRMTHLDIFQIAHQWCFRSWKVLAGIHRHGQLWGDKQKMDGWEVVGDLENKDVESRTGNLKFGDEGVNDSLPEYKDTTMGSHGCKRKVWVILIIRGETATII